MWRIRRGMWPPTYTPDHRQQQPPPPQQQPVEVGGGYTPRRSRHPPVPRASPRASSPQNWGGGGSQNTMASPRVRPSTGNASPRPSRVSSVTSRPPPVATPQSSGQVAARAESARSVRPARVTKANAPLHGEESNSRPQSPRPSSPRPASPRPTGTTPVNLLLPPTYSRRPFVCARGRYGDVRCKSGDKGKQRRQDELFTVHDSQHHTVEQREQNRGDHHRQEGVQESNPSIHRGYGYSTYRFFSVTAARSQWHRRGTQ